MAFGAALTLDDVIVGKALRQINRRTRDPIDSVSRMPEFTLTDDIVEEICGHFPGEQLLTFKTLRTVPIEFRTRLADALEHALFIFFGLGIELVL